MQTTHFVLEETIRKASVLEPCKPSGYYFSANSGKYSCFMLMGALQHQVCNDFGAVDDHFPCKHLADGFKRVCVRVRVRVLHFLTPQPSSIEKGRKVWQVHCNVLVE